MPTTICEQCTRSIKGDQFQCYDCSTALIELQAIQVPGEYIVRGDGRDALLIDEELNPVAKVEDGVLYEYSESES